MFPPSNLPAPIRVTDPAVLRAIQALRQRAWAADGEVPDFIAGQDIFTDPHDQSAIHFAMMADGKPVVAARLNLSDDIFGAPDADAYEGYEDRIPGPVASLTRLVVDPACRGLGAARRMDDIRMEAIRATPAKSVVGVAELPYRIRALERMGFRLLGPTRRRYLQSAPSHVLVKLIEG